MDRINVLDITSSNPSRSPWHTLSRYINSMASQTLRAHRSPSPSPAPTPTSATSNNNNNNPSTPVNPANPAKLTRQSLGPPPSSTGSARGFAGLGIASTGAGGGGPGQGQGQARHVSSSVAMGFNNSGRESLSPRPSLGTNGSGNGLGGMGGLGNGGMRAVSATGRPSSEFLPGGGGMREAKTPEGKLFPFE